ncbi:PREDICTED: uncharacterized protein LOC109482662 [Branchiostoma belcheri]|uniref:Uncharacterized protein LOC109482662 n=1 Tax=Branchiostoma belcheri TaxID=7741 RepID=A0A6P5A441_BRABE|nr:PREDICTED: uncharacterized protein LOC109482662 [Branchiostoma belcheri]
MGSAASKRKKNTAAKLSAVSAVTSKTPKNEEPNTGNDSATLQQEPVLQQKETENGHGTNGTNGNSSTTMQQDAVLQPERPADRHLLNGGNKNGETVATTHDGYITEEPKRTYTATELKQLVLAAVIIQRWFRGYRTRKDLETEQRMARLIQRKFRRHCLTVKKAVLHERPSRNTASPVPSPRMGQRSPRRAKLADPVGERSPLLIRKFGQARPDSAGTTSTQTQEGKGEKGQGSSDGSSNKKPGQVSAEDAANNTRGQGSMSSLTADSTTAGQQKGGKVKGQSSPSPSKSSKISDSLVSLQHRKEKREHREQPWTEDTPEHEDLEWKIGDKLQLNIDGYQDDIVSLRWKGEQLEEKAALAARGFPTPPRVVLISSTVPKAKFLPLTVKEDPSVLVVPYDHQNDSFEKILGDIQSKLTSYCPGCKAKSLLMYMQGGPAHLYLKKNKVTTVAKLKKGGHGDMVCFWKALGSLMSKMEPDTTVIHIMGCNVMGYPKYVGIDLFECLQELMKPSIVRFEAPLEMSIEGNAVIQSYFDTNKYKLWKSQRYSNLDRVFGL